jgi:hypothetical protein
MKYKQQCLCNTVLWLCAGAVLKTVQDFVRESELMADLRHPNIVCLIGVCMQEEPKVSHWSSKNCFCKIVAIATWPKFRSLNLNCAGKKCSF